MLEINNLTASVDDNLILRGLSLTVKKGEIHAIMGPNGAGKSTLAKVIAGHPAYEVIEGEVLLDGKNLLEMDPPERAHAGLFMSFQYPVEIPGVSNSQFLRSAYNAKRKALSQPELDEADFEAFLDEKMAMMEIKPEFKARNVNEGFSGGEKKRNEILQLAVLMPEFAILDETDSGLDIDAIRVVSAGVNKIMNPNMGLLMITHYQRLLNFIKPDYVHVMMDGRIVQSGGPEFALELESKGYDWLQPTDREVAGC
ncbi:MAG: Fe-S cluster assembly ATPase SufC [Chlamydiales bacterium]|nr:Fe-S cluster assembly ATPase SufC [Chlamydiales bacterium]